MFYKLCDVFGLGHIDLASASTSASFFPGLVNIPANILLQSDFAKFDLHINYMSYLLCNFYEVIMTVKGRLLLRPHCIAILQRKFPNP